MHHRDRVVSSLGLAITGHQTARGTKAVPNNKRFFCQTLILPWHGLSGPPVPAHATTVGSDKPCRDDWEMAHT